MEILTATDIIYCMDKLEEVEDTKLFTNIENTLDLIFFKAFGFDWERDKGYKYLRKIILDIMEPIPSLTDGYITLRSR